MTYLNRPAAISPLPEVIGIPVSRSRYSNLTCRCVAMSYFGCRSSSYAAISFSTRRFQPVGQPIPSASDPVHALQLDPASRLFQLCLLPTTQHHQWISGGSARPSGHNSDIVVGCAMHLTWTAEKSFSTCRWAERCDRRRSSYGVYGEFIILAPCRNDSPGNAPV